MSKGNSGSAEAFYTSPKAIGIGGGFGASPKAISDRRRVSLRQQTRYRDRRRLYTRSTKAIRIGGDFPYVKKGNIGSTEAFPASRKAMLARDCGERAGGKMPGGEGEEVDHPAGICSFEHNHASQPTPAIARPAQRGGARGGKRAGGAAGAARPAGGVYFPCPAPLPRDVRHQERQTPPDRSAHQLANRLRPRLPRHSRRMDPAVMRFGAGTAACTPSTRKTTEGIGSLVTGNRQTNSHQSLNR